MNRRILATLLAASSVLAIAVATPEAAQSKPLGQQSQNVRFHKPAKARAQHVTRTRRTVRSARHSARNSASVTRSKRATVARTSNSYQDDRFNYGPRAAAPARKAVRHRSARRAPPPTDLGSVSHPYRDSSLSYGPRTAAPERKVVRRRAARRTVPDQVAVTSNSYQDDRFNYGPRTASVREANRRSARNAMARAYVGGAQDRDGGDQSYGPRFAATRPTQFSFGSDVVSEARRWIGTNPTNRRSLWCARFMNFVLERSGYSGTGSDMASSFARYGQRVSGPQVGAIAVMTRGRRGGHVGVVSGIDENGNPIIISGNHGNRVAEAAYPRGRVYAYVMPR